MLETFTFAVLIFAVILLFMMVKTIPQGYEYTVERFGAYTHTMRPGLHFLIPVVQAIGAKMRTANVKVSNMVNPPVRY